MKDTKPFEEEAESHIKSKLLRYDLNVVDPLFDQHGADLLIIKEINTKVSPFVRVQCKGRTLSKTSGTRITIPKGYVDSNFVVFLYVSSPIEIEDKSDLFVFFQKEILEWDLQNDEYVLNIPNSYISTNKFTSALFSKGKIDQIHKILNSQKIELIKKNTSIIIDGLFLQKALKATKAIYHELYPEKYLLKPKIEDIIQRIIDYYGVNKEEDTNCYFIYPKGFGIEYDIDFGNVPIWETPNSWEPIENSYSFNLLKQEIDGFVYVKVEEQLKRLINIENIVLIADDQIYIPILDELKEKGVDLILVKLKTDHGSIMWAKFRWADIMLPLAMAIGIDRSDL